jgi:hypothetical protein
MFYIRLREYQENTTGRTPSKPPRINTKVADKKGNGNNRGVKVVTVSDYWQKPLTVIA